MRGTRRGADGIEIDLGHSHVELFQNGVRQLVVAVEAAPQTAAPSRYAAIGRARPRPRVP